jgi:hypothetical protein
VRYIKCDGERGISSHAFDDYAEASGIKVFVSSSKFTNHNRVVDRVIRTIRDKHERIPITEQSLSTFTNFYNNSPHKAFNNLLSPTELLNHPDIEELYITYKFEQNREALVKQKEKGLLQYRPGNILMIHLTPERLTFIKLRRRFGYLAEFVKYINGNVECNLLKPLKVSSITYKTVIIPIWDTRYLCDDLKALKSFGKEYSDTFDYEK